MIRHYDGESHMHWQHRLQRFEARVETLAKFPDVYVPRICETGISPITGEMMTQDFGRWQHADGYEAQYLKELRKVRARRFRQTPK